MPYWCQALIVREPFESRCEKLDYPIRIALESNLCRVIDKTFHNLEIGAIDLEVAVVEPAG